MLEYTSLTKAIKAMMIGMWEVEAPVLLWDTENGEVRLGTESEAGHPIVQLGGHLDVDNSPAMWFCQWETDPDQAEEIAEGITPQMLREQFIGY